MKISLLHSADAGDGVSAESLRHEFERAGHQLVHAIEEDAHLERVVDGSTELLVAAGGDGTVARAATALAGRAIPLAILPLGTANNIATSLAIEGSVSRLVESWTGARQLPLDLGIASGSWGESRFLEAVGGGLISRGIVAMESESPSGSDAVRGTGSRLARAARCYREVLSRLIPRRLTVRLDGARMSGDFLLLEVLNIRSIGPNLVLSEDADPFDGLFHVVTAGEEHRAEVDAYLRHQIAGSHCRLALPTRRARQVEIEGWAEMHVDDQVQSGPAASAVSIRMQAAAVQVLLPESPTQVRGFVPDGGPLASRK
jgi:diacylglycerol kinase (ATP)